jgi:hypothetical protein
MLPAAANAQARSMNSMWIPLNQALTATNGTVNIAGFNLASFQVINGQLMAVGSLVGTATNTATNQTSNFVTQVAVPVSDPASSCDILHLTLGPINLNLLGLVVQTNEIHLDITAQQGSGNLLGNLLCSVTGLLNGGGPLQQVANLLNQILAAL